MTSAAFICVELDIEIIWAVTRAVRHTAKRSCCKCQGFVAASQIARESLKFCVEVGGAVSEGA